jgi:DNA-binding transcriptional MerR regulator
MKDLSIKKLYYSISEVSKITQVEQYVLRYWETEFEELNPQKNRAGNRIYTNKDIQLILHIKSLLRDKRYTIEGAKKILQSGSIPEPEEKDREKEKEVSETVPVKDNPEKKDKTSLKKDLEEIKSFLELILTKL